MKLTSSALPRVPKEVANLSVLWPLALAASFSFVLSPGSFGANSSKVPTRATNSSTRVFPSHQANRSQQQPLRIASSGTTGDAKGRGSSSNTDRSTSAPISKVDLDKLGIEYVASRKIGESAQRIWEYKLKKNGLSILISERHTMPVATVMVVYHVGSRNEAVGYTGSTHFLEHMMFKGTTKHDPLKGTGLDDVLKPIGGYNNATTSYDRTNYFEIVPSKNINVCLDLEADRMRHLLLRQKITTLK